MAPQDRPDALAKLVGSWITTATHPALPGVVVTGTAVVEWLEGERFLIQRSRFDHPDFPASIAVIGETDRDRIDETHDSTDMASQLTMHYFDSRGVFRVYQAGIDDSEWRLWRNAPGFSQRFTGTLTDGGNSIVGLWEMCRDDITWEDDLAITFRRG